MNGPIKGHELIRDGVTWILDGSLAGGCRCGAKPPMNGEFLPLIREVKRWHRRHKAELRGPVANADDALILEAEQLLSKLQLILTEMKAVRP